uniref:AI-2E family transporter n=1 Tax=Tetradesmus obliquus TaxID=3088 RepID=A0A383VRY6_TETOB|eukprot:jgi/Sobl393_1/17136/SZX68277.1
MMAQQSFSIQRRSLGARNSRQQQLRHFGPSTVQQFRAPWQPLQPSPLQQRHEQLLSEHSTQPHSLQQDSSSSSSRPLLQPGAAARRSTAVAAAAAAGGAGAAVVVQEDNKSELYSLIHSIPYRRLLLWAGVAAVGWQMHDFFGIVMGTFIVAFIGNSFITNTIDSQLLQMVQPQRDTRRRLLVVIYFAIIIAFITLFGVMTIPDIVREGADFIRRLKSDNVWVILVEKMRHGLGDVVMESLERFVMLATSNDITRAAIDHGHVWTAERSTQLGMAVSSMLKGYTTTAAQIITAMLKSVTKFTIQVGVAMIFGFFMLWDLPTISAGVSSLAKSRLAPLHAELAPVLSVFGKLFGRALEAQARIALVNTALTALGMWALAIPGIGLMSMFVFICSFIPIAGVIISTTPIGFVALTEYGFIKLALVIIMVTGVHFVEAYMLNPAIYSAHLKLHPLMVLVTLVIAEHSLGVWGLLLAVPLTVFALDYLIRYPDSSVTEVGAKELEKVMHTHDEGDHMPSSGSSSRDGSSSGGSSPVGGAGPQQFGVPGKATS